MFDFGNKKEKEIELLHKKVTERNFEISELRKTVEFLVGEIDNMKESLKEKDEEIDYLERKLKQADKDYNFMKKTYKEIIDSKEEKINIIMNKYFFKENAKTLTIDKKVCIEVAPIKYIEMKDKVRKITSDYKDKKYAYFRENNFSGRLINNDYIKRMFEDEEVPTYNGIPFRSLQDLYNVIDFLTEDKYVDYKNEREHIEINNKSDDIAFFKISKNIEVCIVRGKDKYIIDDDFIKKFENSRNGSSLDGIKTCPIKLILTYNNKCFRSKKELMKLVKEECYHNKNTLNKVIKALNN